jgi:hypothetical protein
MLSPDMPTVVAQSTREGRSLNAIRLSTSTVNAAPDALSRSRYVDPGNGATDRSLNLSPVPRAAATPGRTPSRVEFVQESVAAPQPQPRGAAGSPAIRRRPPQPTNAAPGTARDNGRDAAPTLQATESVRYFRPGQNDWSRSRD